MKRNQFKPQSDCYVSWVPRSNCSSLELLFFLQDSFMSLFILPWVFWNQFQNILALQCQKYSEITKASQIISFFELWKTSFENFDSSWQFGFNGSTFWISSFTTTKYTSVYIIGQGYRSTYWKKFRIFACFSLFNRPYLRVGIYRYLLRYTVLCQWPSNFIESGHLRWIFLWLHRYQSWMSAIDRQTRSLRCISTRWLGSADRNG